MAVVAGLASNALSKIQWRILGLLEDGRVHSFQEIIETSGMDELCDNYALAVMIANMRPVLRGRGFDIVNLRGVGYRLMMNLPTAE